MIINQYNFLDPVFNGVTQAWPLNETENKMRRGVLNGNNDLLPVNVTLVSGRSKFTGAGNSYMAGPADGLSVDTNTSFTWCFTLKPSSLPAGVYDVLGKGDGVFGGNAEYRVYLDGSNIRFRLYSTTTTTTVSATLTSGIDNIIFLVYDSVAQQISVKVNSAAPITAAHTYGCRAMYGALTLGNSCGAPFIPTLTPITSTSINSAMGNLIFWRTTALTSTQQATVRTILTTTGFPWATQSEVDYTLDPDTLDSSVKKHRYDFTDLSSQWQDTGKLIPVVNNDDPIRVIEDLWATSEEATAPSDAERPLSKANTVGPSSNLPSAYSTNLLSKLVCTNDWQSASADFAMFIVAKNDRNTTIAPAIAAGGSHWMQGGGGTYVTATGLNYGNGYLAAHMTQGPAPNGPVNSTQIVYPYGFNILELSNVSQIWNAIANGYVPLVGARDVNNISAMDLHTFFEPAPSKVANEWWAIGNIAEALFIEDTLTKTERARIRNFLAIKHGVVATYMGY